MFFLLSFSFVYSQLLNFNKNNFFQNKEHDDDDDDNDGTGHSSEAAPVDYWLWFQLTSVNVDSSLVQENACTPLHLWLSCTPQLAVQLDGIINTKILWSALPVCCAVGNGDIHLPGKHMVTGVPSSKHTPAVCELPRRQEL